MIGPYRLAWSLIGRHLILDLMGDEVVRPVRDVGQDWYKHKDDWERMAPLIVAALNEADEKENAA